MVWYGNVWSDMVWCGMVMCGMVMYGTVWYGMAWYGNVWHGMVLYGMVRYCMVSPNACIHTCFVPDHAPCYKLFPFLSPTAHGVPQSDASTVSPRVHLFLEDQPRYRRRNFTLLTVVLHVIQILS